MTLNLKEFNSCVTILKIDGIHTITELMSKDCYSSGKRTPEIFAIHRQCQLNSPIYQMAYPAALDNSEKFSKKHSFTKKVFPFSRVFTVFPTFSNLKLKASVEESARII